MKFKIENYAFENCRNLESITIPNSITKIGIDAFDGCNDLTVHCKKGSNIEKYCIENGIRYETEK